MSGRELRRLRTDLQMVFQDPHAALNPSMSIVSAVGHPLRIHGLASGDQVRAKVVEALEKVGLSPAEQFLDAYPGDLSGGQKQRAVIARAIITEPEVLVADEPVSMLDMSVRAKILQLMLDLRHDLGLTYLYITHDLATAKFFCDRIAIMYLGRIVEIGPTEAIFADPKHPYTKALLKAIPEPDPRRMVPRDLPRGEIPDAARPPLGCAFHPRCPEAVAECGWESRDLRAAVEEHWTRQSPEVYTEEQSLLDDLEALQEPAKRVVLGRAASAEEVRSLLEECARSGPRTRCGGRRARRVDLRGGRGRLRRRLRPVAATRRAGGRGRGGLRAVPRAGDRCARRGTRAEPASGSEGTGGGVPPQAGQMAWC